jgi:hypothetical protein
MSLRKATRQPQPEAGGGRPPAPVKSSPTGPIPGSYLLNRMLDGGLVAARGLDPAEDKHLVRISLIP